MSLSLEERVASLEHSLQASNEQLRILDVALQAIWAQTAQVRASAMQKEYDGMQSGPNTGECARTQEAPAHKAYAKILFDGGSRGNPGLCGTGYVIYTCSSPWTENSEIAPVKGKAIVSKCETNNYAEYSALILALRHAKDLGVTELQILGDSKLVINQLRGEWKCGNKLRPLYEYAAQLLSGFNSCVLEHIPRAQNAVADGLANEAMDAHDL